MTLLVTVVVDLTDFYYYFSAHTFCSCNKPEPFLLSLKVPLAPVSYLSQLAENNGKVFLLIHLLSDGLQAVFDGGGTEAAVELVYIIIVEGERLIADSHLGDLSYSALVC